MTGLSSEKLESEKLETPGGLHLGKEKGEGGVLFWQLAGMDITNC